MEERKNTYVESYRMWTYTTTVSFRHEHSIFGLGRGGTNDNSALSNVKCSMLTVNAMQNAINADSQTAFTGTSCLFTLCQNSENGMAPSLENAYAILTKLPT